MQDLDLGFIKKKLTKRKRKRSKSRGNAFVFAAFQTSVETQTGFVTSRLLKAFSMASKDESVNGGHSDAKIQSLGVGHADRACGGSGT
ncbi:hypothetical protein V6Z11_A09G119200 [Gossypium hirsutum]